MSVCPDFYLELSYDETTFHEVMAEVADVFPNNWRAYHGVESGEPLVLGDTRDARELMNTASQLLNAAASLSNRRLPQDRKEIPQRWEAQAQEDREARETLIQRLEKLSEDGEGKVPREVLESVLRKLRRLRPHEDQYRVFRSFLEIESFERFGHLPGELADRVVKLLDFLARTSSSGAQRYLERVARCYVLDLGPELAVMSRSVLESALKALELERLVDEVTAVRRVRYSSLSDWTEAASKAGLIDEKGRIAADLVRDAGNDAVHAAPGTEADAEEILASLVIVLEQLERAGHEDLQ